MMHLISEPGRGAEVDKHRAVGINSVYGKGGMEWISGEQLSTVKRQESRGRDEQRANTQRLMVSIL